MDRVVGRGARGARGVRNKSVCRSLASECHEPRGHTPRGETIGKADLMSLAVRAGFFKF